MRGWLTLGGCYVAVRVALVATLDPFTDWPDTAGYKGPVSLVGSAERPWLVPLLQTVLADRAMMFLQTAVSAVAFVVLAAALAATVQHRAVKVGIASVVSLVGLSTRVTVWDRAMLSESLAISLTMLLIAAIAMLDRVPAWVTLAVFVAWVFVRDSHALLGVPVAVGVGVWAWRHHDRVLLAGFVVVAAWGLAASQNNRWVEGFNLATHVAWRLDADQEQAIGVPDVPALHMPTGGEQQRVDQLFALMADPTFRDWAEGPGSVDYVRYAVTHPSFMFGGLQYLWTDYGFFEPSMLEHTTTTPPGGQPASIDWAWPRDPLRLIIAALAATALAVLFAVRAGRMEWSRWVLPGLLLVSTIPHALLIYHGSGIEINRHSIELGLVLMIAVWWMLVLGVDQLCGGEQGVVEQLVDVGLDAGVEDSDAADHKVGGRVL